MLCERVLKLLATNGHRASCVPIWSCRSSEKLVSLRVSPQPWPLQASRHYCSPTPPTPPTSTSSGSKTESTSLSFTSALEIEMCHGLPQITVPLPSRAEPCLFTLRPVTHTVGDFLNMLRCEDAGIDRAIVRTTQGVRIAAATSVQTLLRNEFDLLINDSVFRVMPPPSITVSDDLTNSLELSAEEVKKMGDVRALVSQLYEKLNVEEFQMLQEKKLMQEMESLRAELEPLERQRLEIAKAAEKRTNTMAWVGLGLMSVQFGVLARLTWFEYSWDIMEPVTYFVTYGTAMAAYAYFVLTKEDYVLPEVRDRQYLISFHKKAKRNLWDVHKYNSLKDGIAAVERDLKRLRDPLRLRLPKPSFPSPPGAESLLNMDNIKSMLRNKLS